MIENKEKPSWTIAQAARFLVKNAPNELSRLGLPSNYAPLRDVLKRSKIGSGMYGIVFDLEDGRVLKLTRDSEDAYSCKAVLDAGGIDGVVRVHDVFTFAGKDYSQSKIGAEVYGIIQDKIISFQEIESRISKKASDRFYVMLNKALESIYNRFPNISDDAVSEVRTRLERHRYSPVEVEVTVRWTEHLIRTLIELRHIKVFVFDLHPLNVGFVFRGEDLDVVLFDLGNRSFRGNRTELRLAANI